MLIIRCIGLKRVDRGSCDIIMRRYGGRWVSIELIGWLTLAYAIAMLQVPAGIMISMFCFALVFQAAAAVKVSGTGVTPSHILLLVFVIVLFIRRYEFSKLRNICHPPNAGFWMLLLGAYCLLTGIFLPRLFSNLTYVNPIGNTSFEESDSPVPLGPSSGNWTQSVYMFGSIAVFLATSLFLSRRHSARQIAVALLTYSTAIVSFGFLDLATDAVGAGSALDFMHNGNYTLHLHEAVLGLKRIAGSFTEASAFADATLGTLGFTLGLCLAGTYPAVSATLSFIEIGMLLLSTSSTAYVGLVFVLGGAYLLALKNLIWGQPHITSFVLVVFTPLIGTCVLTVILLYPAAFSAVSDMVAAVVSDKANSSSALERLALNNQAIINVIDTFGIGTGNGSVRTSSFPLAVIANLGIGGSFIYCTILILVFFGRESQVEDGFERSVQAAARLGAWGTLSAACISGTLVDLGLPFFVLAAVACNVKRQRGTERSFNRLGYGANSNAGPSLYSG